jgi:hypothetical protein
MPPSSLSPHHGPSSLHRPPYPSYGAHSPSGHHPSSLLIGHLCDACRCRGGISLEVGVLLEVLFMVMVGVLVEVELETD